MIENDQTMISVEEAKSIIAAHSAALSAIKVPIEQAAFLTLAEDVLAPNDVPAFRQSAMDGYALRYADYVGENALLLEGEMAAGTPEQFELKENQIARIFTGAPMPEFADTVVIQEKVTLEENQVILLDNLLQQGDNVRGQGTEIAAGATALKSGEYLGPGAIGFLASIGIAEVAVFPRPCIHLIVTGKELQRPGETLIHGQVYEANSYSLKSALHQLHFDNVKVHFVDDDLIALKNELATTFEHADLILLTGGVSKGKYDFVIESAKHCGVVQLFHQIKQKPGKPMYFGMKDQIPVFGLPGNPASVLTCFYEYVLPALAGICRQKELLLPRQEKSITKGLVKKDGFTCFLKGFYNGDEVTPLDAQESFRLSSFASANCLICLQDSKNHYQVGDIVEIHIIH